MQLEAKTVSLGGAVLAIAAAMFAGADIRWTPAHLQLGYRLNGIEHEIEPSDEAERSFLTDALLHMRHRMRTLYHISRTVRSPKGLALLTLGVKPKDLIHHLGRYGRFERRDFVWLLDVLIQRKLPLNDALARVREGDEHDDEHD